MRRLVYEGPRGCCPCCDRLTDIRIGSTLGSPAINAWTVPVNILSIMYRAVAQRVKQVSCSTQLYVTDPSEYDATVRTKFFFVGGCRDEIAGPFGALGLKVFLSTTLDVYENTNEYTIYIVRTTSKTLSRIINSPYAREPEPTTEIEPF